MFNAKIQSLGIEDMSQFESRGLTSSQFKMHVQEFIRTPSS